VTKSQFGECKPGGHCTFDIELANRGPGRWIGTPAIMDVLPVAGIQLAGWQPPSWLCVLVQNAVMCEHPPVTISEGKSAHLVLTLAVPHDLHDGVLNCVNIDTRHAGQDLNPANDRHCVPIDVYEPPKFKPLPPTPVTPPVLCGPGEHLEHGECVTPPAKAKPPKAEPTPPPPHKKKPKPPPPKKKPKAKARGCDPGYVYSRKRKRCVQVRPPVYQQPRIHCPGVMIGQLCIIPRQKRHPQPHYPPPQHYPPPHTDGHTNGHLD
jgi:hypothetical protein